MSPQRLDVKYFQNENVTEIAESLLGKVLISEIDGFTASGIIVETEAYCGVNDMASHARNGRKTKRNEVMFWDGGYAYIYLCYGIHHLFNIVTNRAGIADAVLIRGIQPLSGIETMMQRRNVKSLSPKLTAGPALLSKALGISLAQNGTMLNLGPINLEDRGFSLRNSEIVSGPRVGVQYAGIDAYNPWRFRIKNNPWCSPAK